MFGSRPPLTISPGLYDVRRLPVCGPEDVSEIEQAFSSGSDNWASGDGTLYKPTRIARVPHPEKPITILQSAHLFDLQPISPNAIALQGAIDEASGQAGQEDIPEYSQRLCSEMTKRAAWVDRFAKSDGLRLFIWVSFDNVSRMAPLVGLTLTNAKGEAPTQLKNLFIRPVVDGRPGGRVWVQGKKYPDLYVPVKKN